MLHSNTAQKLTTGPCVGQTILAGIPLRDPYPAFLCLTGSTMAKRGVKASRLIPKNPWCEAKMDRSGLQSSACTRVV